MESQPQNPEFRDNSENFHPCILRHFMCIFTDCQSIHLPCAYGYPDYNGLTQAELQKQKK